MYDLLDQQLSSGWVVYYDVAWLARRQNNQSLRDGQTDFILAHPIHGVLVIELKGGQISYDGKRLQWQSTDAGGVTHDITNPFYQAKTGKYALRESLSILLNLSNDDIRLYHAVAFPGTDRPEVMITEEADPGIIIGRQDLAQLNSRVNQILAYSRGHSSFDQGPSILSGLERLLARSTTLPNPLRSQIDDEHAEIQSLTNTQIELFRRLQGSRRLAIGGGAGSGKTHVAVQRARELARQGIKTLLLCYGEQLASFLKSLVGREPNLEVMSARDLASKYVPDVDPSAADADDVFPGKLLEAATQTPHPPYDALLIDEGQDFTEDWFVAIEAFIPSDDRGILYVFHDTNNQVLRKNCGRLPKNLLAFQLEENLRNTQRICRMLKEHYSGDVPIAPRGPEGRAVELSSCADEAMLKQKLSQALTRLLLVENLLAKEIVVLTPRPIANSALPQFSFPHGIRLVANPDDVRARSVLVSSVADFKGLERPVVLIAELDDKLPTDRCLRDAIYYVAFSRPRNLLAVFASPERLPEIELGLN